MKVPTSSWALVFCSTSLTWVFAGALAAAQTARPDLGTLRLSMAEVAFRINAQPIEGALREFASQAHLQLIYETAEVRVNARSHDVIGEFTPQMALSRLLTNTNLGYKMVNERTVAIRPVREVDRNSIHAPEPVSIRDEDGAQPEADASSRQTDHRDTHSRALETVVITSQKREESILDVPMSVQHPLWVYDSLLEVAA